MTEDLSATAVLDVRDVRRLYAGDTGLRGVSIELRSGEMYALLGPNGAGKTSLIRAVCGRLRLDGGEVRIDGRDPAEPDARRALGLVPQQIALHPELTVRENLVLLGRLAGVSSDRIAEAVTWGLDWADLTSRAKDRTYTLSGGMKRRLNLVAGVLHRPKVLLLDEPTVGVDPDARLRLHALLERLKNDGMALLLTTHDLAEAEQLADRIGLLVDGTLRAEGTLDALVAETFDDRRHVEIVLAERPAAEAEARLTDAGLRASRDPCRWLGARPDGVGGLEALERELAADGITSRQVKIVNPGLREVFLHVTGEDFVS